jgi:hypothetical protein
MAGEKVVTAGPMASLNELLGTGDKRNRVIDDCCRVLDDEVADKGGLSGVAIKGAYSVVKGIKPGFVRDVVNALLDDFLRALDPIYQEALERRVSPGAHLQANSGRAAEGLLAVTDKRAERAERAIIKKTYEKLRPSAKKQVEAAAPRLARLLDTHLA